MNRGKNIHIYASGPNAVIDFINRMIEKSVPTCQNESQITLLTKPSDISKTLESIHRDIKNLTDTTAKPVISSLLNLVENLFSDYSALKDEVQRLKDMINYLQGEQGKPHIKPNTNRASDDVSSEQERKQAEMSAENKNTVGFKLNKNSLQKLKEQRIPTEILNPLENLSANKYETESDFVCAVAAEIGADLTKQYITLLLKYARYKKRIRNAKLPEIKIDREKFCPVDAAVLPEDAVFKRYQEKTTQDLIIKTDNVKFYRQVYYSASLKKTYTGPLPQGYEGGYGPHIKSDIISMKYVNNMSIPKILEFYRNFNISISNSYISDRLVNHLEPFHKEKSDLYEAALEVCDYQQIDDTTCRVNGRNCYTQIVCNDCFTAFFTTERKDRLTILDILRNFGPRGFIFNNETFSLLEQLKVSKTLIKRLHEVEKDKPMSEKDIKKLFAELFPNADKGQLHRTRITETAAIAYYHQEIDIPIVKVLHCDDAPQFKLLTENLSLCWIHDGRHYKRLQPVVLIHKEQLALFRQQYWQYYGKLLKFKKNPSEPLAQSLSDEFDDLFSTTTNYYDLDQRIAKTKAKNEELLLVLKHPELPLHNNLSENGARVQKRREDVSLHTKSAKGTKAKDTMMSIVETCKKHGISSYKFIEDRVHGTFRFLPLADLIRLKATGQKPYDTS